MFNLGLHAEKITRKPYIPTLEENNVRQGFFEKSEFEAILARLPGWLKPCMTFAYLTGWRLRSEALLLKWANVDLEEGTVTLDPGTTKNKEGRVIYLPRELQDLLEVQWQDHLARYSDCPFVFHRLGKRIRYPYVAWRKACREAGLAGKIPHDFRRTAVRNMVRAGIPERVAMRISGHKTRSIFDRYHIVSKGDLKEAARRLEGGFPEGLATVLATVTPSEQEGTQLTH